MSNYIYTAKYLLGAYFILSIIITGWFVYSNYKEDSRMTVSLQTNS